MKKKLGMQSRSSRTLTNFSRFLYKHLVFSSSCKGSFCHKIFCSDTPAENQGLTKKATPSKLGMYPRKEDLS